MPANISALTALDIGALPYAITQNMTGVPPSGGGEQYPLWYRLPASLVTGGMMFGMLGTSLSVLPFLKVRIYTGPAAAPVAYLGANSTNLGQGRLQVPLADVAQDYYLELYVEDFGAPPVYDVSFSAYTRVETAAIDALSILVNSDADAVGGVWPAAVFGTVTYAGDITRYVFDLAAGETGDIVASGVFALNDDINGDIKIYNPDLTPRASVALDGNLSSGNQVDRFYAIVDVAGLLYLKSFSINGVLQDTWGPLPAGSLMSAVNRAETIAYITDGQPNGTSTGGTVFRWDLVNDVQLANLAAPFTDVNPFDLQFSGVSPGGVLVLPDETILVVYYRSNGADTRIRRYTDAGVLVLTYDFAGGTWKNVDRIAHDTADDGVSFWVWIKGSGANFGRGLFRQIRASDGATLGGSIESVEVQFGYQHRSTSVLDSHKWGHPFSCPFLLLRSGVAIPEDEEPEPCVLERPSVGCWSGDSRRDAQSITVIG